MKLSLSITVSMLVEFTFLLLEVVSGEGTNLNSHKPTVESGCHKAV